MKKFGREASMCIPFQWPSSPWHLQCHLTHHSVQIVQILKLTSQLTTGTQFIHLVQRRAETTQKVRDSGEGQNTYFPATTYIWDVHSTHTV